MIYQFIEPLLTEVYVYLVNETTLELRLKRPDPPNGQLEQYRVKYKSLDKNFTKITPCSYMSDYDCITITNLGTSKNYSLQVIF